MTIYIFLKLYKFNTLNIPGLEIDKSSKKENELH